MFTRNILVILFTLLTFFACTGEDSRQMHEALMQAKAQNENFEPFTTDSTMLRVVDYYDSHGTANEQMLAHYLLGCVYRDLGDAPRALECYYDAVSKADTTDADCDFQRLSRIYGQMADLFYKQKIMRNAIDFWFKASKYSYKSGETFNYIIFYEHTASAYYLMNKYDSALVICKNSMNLFKEHGYIKESYDAMPTFIMILIKQDRLQEARSYIKDYETNSNLFNNNGHIQKGKELYYYIKGIYNLKLAELDSSVYYFRKLLDNANNYNRKESAYEGLLKVYQEIGENDSVAKYAKLYCEINDSAQIKLATIETVKHEALYNYSRNKLLAEHKALEASKMALYNVILIFLICISLGTSFIITIYYRNKRKQANKKNNETYSKLVEQYRQSQKQFSLFKHNKEKAMLTQKAEIEYLQNELAKYHEDRTLPEHWNINDALINNYAIKEMHNLAAKGKCPTETNWTAIIGFVKQYEPNFYESITNNKFNLSIEELKICILIKLRFIPSEIIILLNISNQQLTNKRNKLNLRINGEKGAKNFDAYLRRL